MTINFKDSSLETENVKVPIKTDTNIFLKKVLNIVEIPVETEK